MVTQFFCNQKLVLTKKNCMPLERGSVIIIKEEKAPYDETAYLIQDSLPIFSEGEMKNPFMRVYLRETIHPEERN